MANYILKNKMWSDAKMNRLIKQITTNANDDRDSAKDLLSRCTDALKDLGEQAIHVNDDGTVSVDAFTKLVAASTQALSQMGVANEKLLKLTQTMQKYQLKEMDLDSKTGSAANELKGSFFSNLTSLVDKE
jgi:hypothetical protein